MFVWDKAIDRAHHLAETVAPAKELLNFYSKLLETQRDVYETLRGRRDWLPSGSIGPGDFASVQ